MQKPPDLGRLTHPNSLVALVSIVHGISSWYTGPPGHEPAVEFLQSIHQNQTVETVRNACVVGFKQ